jgi:hypothetical protein
LEEGAGEVSVQEEGRFRKNGKASRHRVITNANPTRHLRRSQNPAGTLRHPLC